MTVCPWEKIDRFVSPGELRRFQTWMDKQIAAGLAGEIVPPTNEQVIPGERWFEHLASGSLWRLVPADGPLVPGFWPIETRTPSDSV